MRIRITGLDDNGVTRRFPIEISKKAVVKELKAELNRKFAIPVEHQMMIYLGRVLEDEGSLLDYRVCEGCTVNLVVQTEKKELLDKPEQKVNDDNLIETISKFYKNGDFVDVLLDDGAWYEGVVSKIFMKQTHAITDNDEENIIFTITSAEHIIPAFEIDVKFQEIRPRSYYIYKNEELLVGSIVLANYNLEEKKSRGLWYNFEIKTTTRTQISGTVIVGINQTAVENCVIIFKDELMRIEEPKLIEDGVNWEKTKLVPRKYPIHCIQCRDDRNKKCRACSCQICAGKENPKSILLCDECDKEYHTYCLDPPLNKIPSGDWYCPTCKVDDSEIVKKGEVKLTKKQANMPNKKSTSNRDWGKGMACAGRSKICTLVPKDHFGPIPGIEVGTCWMFRMQVSEAGVHRPAVSGIHGGANKGAYSLVISAGYEDDIDSGSQFIYTGSGGRDLSGNKRVSGQSFDQQLTNCNKALALNCNAPFNDKGAEAKDWKKGKPVRVVRNYKAKKHSKFAPTLGNRYDGIYKVVKYYPERGKAGFIVWKYLLKRDDPTPAPWEEGGQEFEMICPLNYSKIEEEDKENETNRPGPSGTSKKQVQTNTLPDLLNKAKKPKLVYKLPDEIKSLIEKDEANKKNWMECNDRLQDGKSNYLAKVQEHFTCICCQDLVYEPVTLECKHSFCKECLKRAFRSKLFTCPCCRHELGEDYQLQVNYNFSQALKLLLPGYGPG